MSRPPAMRVLLALLTMTALAACEGFGSQVRGATYPPDFNYIPPERLQSAMWQLAAHVSTLDGLLREQGAPPDRESVVTVLVAMEQAAARLGPTGWPSNHPRVTQNLARFQAELAAARRAAQLNPPRYFLAGTISGACGMCHAAW